MRPSVYLAGTWPPFNHREKGDRLQKTGQGPVGSPLVSVPRGGPQGRNSRAGAQESWAVSERTVTSSPEKTKALLSQLGLSELASQGLGGGGGLLRGTVMHFSGALCPSPLLVHSERLCLRDPEKHP